MTRLVRALLLAAVALVVTAAPGTAQDSSTPSDYPPSGGSGVLNFGVQRQGGTFTKEDCGFAPRSTAQISLNGRDIFTKAAESDGCVRLTVQVVDRDTIRIDGTAYDARPCAQNTIGVSGTHRNGGTLSYDNRFRIDCANAAGAALPRTGTSDAAGLSAAGAGLVVVGVLLAIVARRRRSAATLAES